jgi:AcrR family transcriptional regulator
MTAGVRSSGERSPSKFDVRREATRAELIRLGIERLPQLGYSSTTIEDVVRGTGRTRGAFYFHFASKEDFFEALLLERAAARGRWWELADRPDVTSIEQALAIVFARFEEVDPGGGQWALLAADYAKSVQDEPERLAALRAIYTGWIGEIVEFIGVLRARGLARTDSDERQLAAETFAVAEGHYLHQAVYGAEPTGLIDAMARVLRA